MADVIQIILTAKNDASKTITQVEKDITKLQQSGRNISSVDKALSALGTGLAIGAFTATVGMIVEGTAQLSQAGANVDRLRVSFENLAAQNGISGAQITAAIESVTQGTLSQQQIMEQANAAMLLGVADTADEFSTLAKIAVDRGRAMGISMEDAFESIVKGVGRMSPLILDNLGIVIDADKTYGEYAKTLGKTADALTDLEKRQALIARLKVEVADFDPATVNDAASAWEKLAAAQANAAAAAGSWINTNSTMVGILGALTTGLDVFSGKFSSDPTTQLKGLEAQLKQLNASADEAGGIRDYIRLLKEESNLPSDDLFIGLLEAMANRISEVDTNKLDEITSKISNLKQVMAGEAKSQDLGAITIQDPKELAAELEAAANELATIEEYTKRVAEQMGEGKEAAAGLVRETIDTAGSLQNALPALNDLVEGFRRAKEEAAAMVSAINGATSGFNSAVMGAFADSGFNMDVIEAAKTTRIAFDEALASIENAGYSLYDTEAAAMMAEAQFSESFLAISAAVDESTKSIGGATQKTASLTKEFQNLQGIVEGLLSSATQDIGGLDLESILPHEDTVSENARRLAAIANEGLIDQSWLEEFKNEAPGNWAKLMEEVAKGTDVKTAAAMLLRDFQNGVNPELIDKGKLKEIAKRMFQVDQSTKAMVDEIATELANEMNISIEDAKALVGGAAGVKRVLTDEEKQKIVDEKLSGLEARVGFQFGTRESAIKGGVDSGFLNPDGYLVLPAKIEVSNGMIGLKEKPKEGEVEGVAASGFTVDTSSMEPVEIPTTLKLDAATFDTQITDFNSTNTITANITLPFNVDNTQVAGAGMNAFAVWANAFAMPENLDTFGTAFGSAVLAMFADKSADYILAGVTISNGVLSGFSSTSVGSSIAAEISKQLMDSAAKIEQSGQATGRTWGKGFLDVVGSNIPIDLLNILTDLITPEVLDAVRKQQGMEGAT